ncbi:uncharacterized protein DUF3261 [Acinetobacter calcoaceticus]|uniref:Uncharacterized protein DUF3261 n=1 Tax=Acinetobacter calcoaceticus TaxID=471 RepID=A0A4R1XJN1_ACICA|nr:uncharacterized protein DUF3261 [Acinetobacter calcoaceticus]
MRKIISILCGIGLSLSLIGCQGLLAPAKGLSSTAWVAQQYQRQDQVEVQWKQHSFSFLLYQQQQGQNVDFLALSLTGQQLFKLQFDGQTVKVEQRIDQMKHLPFDYVVRDILYATYPDFAQLQHDQVDVKQLQSPETAQPLTEIYIQQQKVLLIEKQADLTLLKNVQVPYEMTLSPIANSLQEDQQ